MSESVSCPGRNFINASHAEPDASKPWDIHLWILQALLPTPAAAWCSCHMIFCSQASFGQESWAFCWEEGQAVAHFAVISVTLLPPLLRGAALVQTTSLLGLRREWRNWVQTGPLCRTACPLDEAALPQTLGCSGTWGKAPLRDDCGLRGLFSLYKCFCR